MAQLLALHGRITDADLALKSGGTGDVIMPADRRDRGIEGLLGADAVGGLDQAGGRLLVDDALAGGLARAREPRGAEASRALDKAASKGIVHKKTAARRKSRLVKAANSVGAE